MFYTKFFGEIGLKDTPTAGGKGASLGKMAHVGIPVPPGFVVLAGAFERFLQERNLGINIDAILRTVNHREIRTIELASEKIQAIIGAAVIPADIQNEILASLNTLGAPLVAVRSSATPEDSHNATWAGQLDSHMNIKSDDVVHTVQKCWASLFTPRAIFYRFEKNLHTSKISIAVVVQKMVTSDVSGIAFSVHPVTEDHNQIIIEAGWGFGDAVVSGSITPDSYVVEKEPRNILDIHISPQTRRLQQRKFGEAPDELWGENVWKEVPTELQEKQKLSNTDINTLSDIIVRIENHYGFPCDIEWAKEGDTFYITQSRPITTLSKKNTSSHEYRKVMNRSLMLIACEYWYQGERYGIEKLTRGTAFFEPLFIYRMNHGTAVYYDFSDAQQDPKTLASFFNTNKTDFDRALCVYKEKVTTLSNLLTSTNTSVKELFKASVDFWPYLTIMNVLGGLPEEDVHHGGQKNALELRRQTDTVMYQVGMKFKKLFMDILPEELKDFYTVVSYDEITQKTFLTVDGYAERQKGYYLYKGKLKNGSARDCADAHTIVFTEESLQRDQNILYGSSASKGVICGKVKILLENEQGEKVLPGDILVTPMTTPDFLPIMERASAFVTDEGGVTCHAAIIARELGKPCVIGTKIATQVLKDGDLIEVDANRGIVRIL